MRFAVDTGGTFTDLIVEDDTGSAHMFKAATTPRDPIRGVLASLQLAADAFGMPLRDMLSKGELLIHGTTHSINAVITGNTATTGFLTTKGHPDILLLREGGRQNVFDYSVAYPDPYVPRSLTREIDERIDPSGAVKIAFNEAQAREALSSLLERKVAALAVCFLWSIVNPEHERRMGRLIEEMAPGLPFSLSHRVSPTIREYRRASATCLDASLKPLMSRYMHSLEGRLRDAGFNGRVLIVTSQGGVKDCRELADAPIHSLNSGPSMAPVAGQIYAHLEGAPSTAVVADTGGTTYDVSVIRDERIPVTQETWIGKPYLGIMTGFPSVEVKSVGAGGGSIASVDAGGLLSVGPSSAGADPGPVCYGRGGTKPTVTDACLVLGILDPAYFLGGSFVLDTEAARQTIRRQVAEPLKLSEDNAAAAIVELATQNMVSAIEDLTVQQGIDPAQAALIGGGGAAGLNSAAVMRKLGCKELIIPECGAALSAAGALMSDLTARFGKVAFSSTGDFNAETANRHIAELAEQCERFAAQAGTSRLGHEISYFVDARYASQIWEIPVWLPKTRFADEADVAKLEEAFHRAHEALFSFRDQSSAIEIIAWHAEVRCKLRHDPVRLGHVSARRASGDHSRPVFFPGFGRKEARVLRMEQLGAEQPVDGPAIIESPFTTIVVEPGMRAIKSRNSSIVIRTLAEQAAVARGAPDQATDVSGVELAILASRMDSVVKKMANTLMRTARSGVINSAKDYSCAIVTSEHQLLTSADSLPIHVLRGPDLQAEWTARFHQFARGDAYLHNSPYHGGGHAADHAILVPVFDDDNRHRFTVVVKAHQADIGNSAPTTYMGSAKDVYEEGALIFPGVKIQEHYRDNEDIIRMCQMRIRVPKQWRGDYLAMLGAARIGERALEEIAAETGWDRLDQFVEGWFAYSENCMRSAIRELPAGTVTMSSRHDPFPGAPEDGVPVNVSLRIEPEDARIVVDLRDNLDNLPFGLNTTQATAESACLIGVFNSIPPVPRNAGSFGRVKILLKEGCIVGIPRHPCSCSIATAGLADHVANALVAAFAQLADGYGMAEVGRCNPPALAVISGIAPATGEPYINQVFFAATGGAAMATQDAWLTTIHIGNAGVCAMDSIELDELNFPLICQERRLAPDTAGPGRQRGAPGFWVEYGPTVNRMHCVYNSDGSIYPARGVRGGGNGALAAQYKRQRDGTLEPLPIAASIALEPGETCVSLCAAGGGYGSPQERPLAAVRKDLEEGWITPEHAASVYGLVFYDDGTIDESATAARRAMIADTGTSQARTRKC